MHIIRATHAARYSQKEPRHAAAYLAKVATVAAILEPAAGTLVPSLAGDGTLADHTPLRYGAVGAAILFRPLSMRSE